MKVSGNTTKKPRRALRKKTQLYSTLIYKVHKEGSGIPTMDRGLLESSCHRRVLSRIVGSDAARLSRLNRRKVITHHEVHIAFAQLIKRQKKMQAGQPGA